MLRLKKHTPKAAADTLPQEMMAKRKIENSLRELFLQNGFLEIETPTYEYYDVFSSGVNSYNQEQLIKFFDESGRILALRPDMTVPIARMSVTKLEEGLKKFFYISNVFHSVDGEETQAGIEIIGEESVNFDAITIMLAIDAMKKAGFENFKIDMGHVGLFKSIVEGESEESKEAIRKAIDSKNTIELEDALFKSELDDEKKDALVKLVEMFGTEEVFEKAQALGYGKEYVERLKKVWLMIKEAGLSKYVCVDFGMLSNISYYTGIVFRGLNDYSGSPVLSGGRYDTLMADFGRSEAAIGFAMYEKRILKALENMGKLNVQIKEAITISFDEQSFALARKTASILSGQGKNISFVSNDADIVIKGGNIVKGENLC